MAGCDFRSEGPRNVMPRGAVNCCQCPGPLRIAAHPSAMRANPAPQKLATARIYARVCYACVARATVEAEFRKRGIGMAAPVGHDGAGIPVPIRSYILVEDWGAKWESTAMRFGSRRSEMR